MWTAKEVFLPTPRRGCMHLVSPCLAFCCSKSPADRANAFGRIRAAARPVMAKPTTATCMEIGGDPVLLLRAQRVISRENVGTFNIMLFIWQQCLHLTSLRKLTSMKARRYCLAKYVVQWTGGIVWFQFHNLILCTLP